MRYFQLFWASILFYQPLFAAEPYFEGFPPGSFDWVPSIRKTVERSPIKSREQVRYANIAEIHERYDELNKLSDFAIDSLAASARAVAGVKQNWFTGRYNGCRTLVAGRELADRQSHAEMMNAIKRMGKNPFLYLAAIRHVPINDPARPVQWKDVDDLAQYLDRNLNILKAMMFLANNLMDDPESRMRFNRIPFYTLDNALDQVRESETVGQTVRKYLNYEVDEILFNEAEIRAKDIFLWHVLKEYIDRIRNNHDPIRVHPNHSAIAFQILQLYGMWD